MRTKKCLCTPNTILKLFDGEHEKGDFTEELIQELGVIPAACATKKKMLKFEEIAKLTVDVIQENKEEENDETTTLQTPEKMRNEKIREHVTEMIDSSSFHGFVYIFDKRHPVRRAIWFIITIVAFAYACQKVYEGTVEYLDYPFDTARMRIYVDRLEFPAVSLCNLNDLRMSVLNNSALDRLILGDPNVTYNPKEANAIKAKAHHKLKEMLVDCSFNGQKCSAENFTEFSAKQGDRCFTFNSGTPPHKLLEVRGAGMQRSLKLTINIQHYEYYRDGKMAGIHLILHGQDDTPIKMTGAIIPPGFHTYVKVEKKTIINLEEPYATKCGSLKLKYFRGYSMNTCWLEKLTDYVVSACQCKDYFMPGEHYICSHNQSMACMWPKWDEFEKLRLFTCPLPCKLDSYSYGNDLSRSLFPSQQYAKQLANKIRNESHVKAHLEKIETEDQELRFIRDNFLRLTIYYNDLSYEKLEQQPSYDTLEWLGDIGGNIGLFIGAGAMSYFEFIDCFFMLLYTRFLEKFQPESPTSV